MTEEEIKPHKIMTLSEYASADIKGWHSVFWRYDLAGNVAVRYGALPAASAHEPVAQQQHGES